MSYSHPTKKLGKKVIRLDTRTLMLAKYLPAVPVAPESMGYIKKVKKWPMYLNDSLGDCVIAGAGHMVEQWTVYAGAPTLLTDQDILVGYEQVGKYVPGVPSTDQGCDMLTALNYWRNTGFGGHKIYGYAKVNLSNLAEVKQAIYLFGNLYLGVQLPLAVSSAKKIWSAPTTGPAEERIAGSWGGHCIPVVGYGATGSTVITWGNKMAMTWEFFKVYADEAYALLSLDWIGSNKLAASGFNFTQLQQDLSVL